MVRPPSEAFSGLSINYDSARAPTTAPSPRSTRSAASVSAVEDISSRGDRLVVGVDFGTTYSGLKTWPGGNGITSDKVPTEISYIQSTPSRASSIGSTRTISPNLAHPFSGVALPEKNLSPTTTPYRWGFQPSATAPRLRCLKLFLDRQQRLPSYVSPLETANLLRSVDKSVLDAISDYLAALRAHTIDTLTRRYGVSFMASTPIQWVLTVPAVWSDAAKNATRRAAERAGMTTGNGDAGGGIRLISEPEAAAVYTLRAIQPNVLNVGDHFVVCDAGGGTADLISYEITALYPSLLLSESSIGTGGLCGSVFLNYAFEDHCRKRLGKEMYDGLKPKTRQIGLKYWDEYVKRNFKYTLTEEEEEEEDEEISIPFPGLPDDDEKRVEGGFLLLRRDEVRDIFEPVVGQVVKLCEAQVETIRAKGGTVKGIVLVGGFGQSNYLYSRLKEHFNKSARTPYRETPVAVAPIPRIEVMQPLYAWTAVVRGAVLRGLEGSMVVTRKARCHYGTSYATAWEEGKHPTVDRYWSPLWERWMVDDRMQWRMYSCPVSTSGLYLTSTEDISRGQPISERTPICFYYTRNFESGQTLVVEDELMVCESEDAPLLMNESVRPLCTLRTDLSAVPKSEFTTLTTSDGAEFLNLDFALELIVDSASLMFQLKVKGVSCIPYLFLTSKNQGTDEWKVCVWICYCYVSLRGK